MNTLATPIRIRNRIAPNRIVLPPLVICGLHPDGRVNEAVVEHYGSFADGGCGLIIQEATCVSPNGKLAEQQLGLWEDGRVEEMRRIVARCRPSGALLLVQIHHARLRDDPETAVVERIRDDFVEAAVRAEQAGYDGVELHAAHGYLLCTFLNPRLNRRTDRYGEPMQLIREIYEGIRNRTGPEFIVGARVGVDNPVAATGIEHCRALEALGVDLLNLSTGLSKPEDGPLPVPAGFPFSDLAWRACAVKPHVSVPVIAVGGLNDPEKAARLVEGGYADMAAVGRGMLVDPDWARKVLAGQPVTPCLQCSPCHWFRNHESCPGRKRRRDPSS